MTFLKSQKRFGQFETLETKKLFAADLAASADVVSFDPGNCVSALTAGVVDPSDCPSIIDPADCPNVVDPNDCPELGGQEGEPFVTSNVDLVMDPSDCPNVVDPADDPELGGQEGEPVSGPATDIVLANLGNLQNYGGTPKTSPSY